MDLTGTYKRSEYQDLEYLDDRRRILLVRNRITGRIGVCRTVPAEMRPVYEQLRRIDSPQVPRVYEILPDEDALTVIAEYIDGRTIEELLEEHTFAQEEALRIIRSLCDVLTLLHSADPPLICRDLKAENIMIDAAGRVVIVDFDIARIYRDGQTRDTQLLGTREYAAPEQFGYGQTDARTDIYALGVLLNYMLLHRFPSEEKVGGRMGEIVEKCTRMDPEQRYQSVQELAAALPLTGGSETDPAHSGQNKGGSDTADFLPPGFRSRSPWKMLTAVCGYALITWFCFALEITDETGEILRPGVLLMNRLCLWISQILWVFLVFDYRGIRGRIPLCRSRSRFVRLIGYALAWCVLMVLAVLVMVLLENLFF